MPVHSMRAARGAIRYSLRWTYIILQGPGRGHGALSGTSMRSGTVRRQGQRPTRTALDIRPRHIASKKILRKKLSILME
jgi:hypothetical protein